MSSTQLFNVDSLSWWPILSLIGLIILCVIFTMMTVYCSENDDDIPSNEEFQNYGSITRA